MTPRTRSRNLVAALALCTFACKRTQPEAPRPVAPAPVPVPADVAAPPSAPADAGAPPVALMRVRNVSNVPLTMSTNPDLNEMIHSWRLNVSDDRSDRGLVFLNDPAQITRVKLFPVDLPRCDSAAGAGFGGLGATGTFTLAPGEARDLGTWDGLQREEVIDPQRGACLRETTPSPGRFRMHFDQPRQTRHDCQRVLVRYPVVSDGGVPVFEFRCQPRADGSADLGE